MHLKHIYRAPSSISSDTKEFNLNGLQSVETMAHMKQWEYLHPQTRALLKCQNKYHAEIKQERGYSFRQEPRPSEIRPRSSKAALNKTKFGRAN